jgi:S1-C subfamily serine protease
MIRMHQPGDVVDLDVVRYGEHKDFKVKLVEAPSSTVTAVAASNTRPGRGAVGPAAPATVSAKKLGLVVEPLTADAVRGTNITGAQQGVMVRSVEPGGPSETKLFPGDIITGVINPEPRAAIKTVADFQRVMANEKSGDIIGLTASRMNGNEVQTFVVNIRVGN